MDAKELEEWMRARTRAGRLISPWDLHQRFGVTVHAGEWVLIALSAKGLYHSRVTRVRWDCAHSRDSA